MKPSELYGMQLMGSRICHDLSAPLSSLSMGIEMLMTHKNTFSQQHQETLSLLEQGLEAMKIKLELFRYLVGYGSEEELPHMNDIAQLLQRYWAGSRYQCTINMEIPLKGTSARLALGLILTGSEALLRGGTILTTIGTKGISMTLQGEIIDITRGLRQEDPLTPPEITARTLIPWYTKALCELLHQPPTITYVSPQEILVEVG